MSADPRAAAAAAAQWLGAREHFIDGAFCPSADGERRQVLDPATLETIAEVAEGEGADAERAITAARRAFDDSDWSRRPAAERAQLLEALAALIERDADALARLETVDSGKTVEESRWDMGDVASVMRYYAARARELGPDAPLEAPAPNARSVVAREAAGVCAMICPWNYPLLQASWKVAPAIAAGCTMVLKPSELTPLSTLRLAELVREAGIPDGVFNVALGTGARVGAALVESPAVDLVSFTGGLASGRAVMAAAARTVKRVALELGGKNPNIIFADADLDRALEHVLEGALFHAGQICSAGTRLLVESSVHDALVDALAARLERIRLGHGLVEGTEMGPLISEPQRVKVNHFVLEALEAGAELRAGGVPATTGFDGAFYRPTLLGGCDASMRAVQEEIFGPVFTVERFDSEAQALALANGTVYGLAAGFFTRDEARIERVSRALRFGTVWVNNFNVYFAAAPWGGYKQSGVGRELGHAGLDEYLETKHIYRSFESSPLGWFGRR
ncbi:MAG: aldehyde dehydrogenase family protein [Myxococcales bacterium]|nr:aldehyde dehydrogenase family protein [Myxococcales bacterium]